MAINSPLLEDVAIDGAQGILVNITGGPDLGMMEVSEAVAMIEDSADEDAHLIFGYVTLDEPCDEVKITVIATGFNDEAHRSAYQTASGAKVGNLAGKNRYYTAPARTVATSSHTVMQQESQSEQQPVQIAAPAGAGSGSLRHTAHAAHTVSNRNDLDIPAFIRRKSTPETR
jgi:cell division protein FtsZ